MLENDGTTKDSELGDCKDSAVVDASDVDGIWEDEDRS